MTFYFVGLLLGGTLFVFQLWRAIGAIQQYLNLQTLAVFLVAIVVILVAYGLQIFAWTQLMRSCGYSIKPIPAAKGYIFSFIPRYIPGTVWGYWSRNEWLLNEFQIPYKASSMGSILEIVTGIVTAGIVSIYIVAQNVSIERNYAILAIGLLLLFFLVIRFYAIKIMGLQVLHLLIAIFVYFAFWVVYGISLFWFIQQMAHINVNFLDVTSIYSLSWLIGFLFIITPSGLGVREFVLSTLLTRQFFLPENEASFIALSIRFVIYLAELILLLVWVEKKDSFKAIRQIFPWSGV